MAEFFYEDFENGAADGTLLTNANTNFDSISGTPGTMEVDTDRFAVGTRSTKVVAASGTRYGEYDGGAGNKSTVWLTFYLYVEALPNTANTNLIMVYGSAPSLACEIRLATSGALVLRDSTFSTRVTGPTLSTGQWYRVAVRLTPGGGTGMQMKTYTGANLHGVTPDTDATSSTVTWGSATDIREINVGICSATNTVCTVSYDDIHFDDADEWLPDVPGVAPVTFTRRFVIG